MDFERKQVRNYAMKNDHFPGHKWNTADAVTLLRIAGTLLLVFLRPLSMGFFCPFTAFALYHNGRFLTHEILSVNKFRKVMSEWNG